MNVPRAQDVVLMPSVRTHHQDTIVGVSRVLRRMVLNNVKVQLLFNFHFHYCWDQWHPFDSYVDMWLSYVVFISGLLRYIGQIATFT